MKLFYVLSNIRFERFFYRYNGRQRSLDWLLFESMGAINKGKFTCKGSFIAKDFSDKMIFDIMDRLSQVTQIIKILKKQKGLF